MRKFLTALYALMVLVLLVTSPLIFIPYGLLRLVQAQGQADGYMNLLSRLYGKWLFFVARVKIQVKGREHLPKGDRSLVFVVNHQSITDVPILRTVIPHPMGFMSKIELFRVPFIQLWLVGLRCIAIDRNNIRKSMDAIRRGSEQVANGYPMVIFPEGTRSHSNGMRSFKGGALKLAEWAKGRIIPVTLDGAYRLLPKEGIGFHETVTVTFHPAIDTYQMDREEMKKLPQRLWEIVNSGLETPNTEVMAPKGELKDESV